MLRKLLVGLLVVVPVLRWSVGCSSSHPDTISQYPGETSRGLKPDKQLPPMQSAKLCIQTARQLEAAGYLADAAQQYERARRFNPLDSTISHRLAIVYDRLGDTNRAAVEYEYAIKAQPSNSDLQNDFGYFHYARGNWDRAEQAFRKALSINSSHTRAITNLAMTLAQQNRYDESIKYFEKVVAPASAYSNLAAIQAQQGHIELARKTVDKALMFNPDLAQARAIQGFINEQEKRTANARPVTPAAAVAAPVPAPKAIVKSASAKPAKFVPVVADPVIAPKPQTQTLASAAPTRHVHVEVVPEAVTPAVPAPAAAAPAPLEPVAAPVVAVPAPVELPPIIAAVQQRKMIAPVGIRPAREEELAMTAVATPDPADIAPMVTPAPIRNAELAAAVPVESPASDAPRESRHEAFDATAMVAPAEPSAARQPIISMPALHAEEAPASHMQGQRVQAVSPDVMIAPAPLSNAASLPEADAAPAAAHSIRPSVKNDALEAAVMIDPVQVSANAAVIESRPLAAAPVQPVQAPDVAPATPMIEAVTPTASEARIPALRPDRAVAKSSPRESSEELAVALATDSAVTQVPAQAVQATTPVSVHEIIPPRKDTASPISRASARSEPLEVAAAAPAPAPEQAEAAAPVAHAQAAPVWIEPPPQVRFTKGRGPSLHRNLQ